MFTKTKRHYEVLAYRNPDREPYPAERTTRMADALRTAKEWANRYPRVEVNAVFVSADDANDVQGTELITAYENGERTTK